MRDEIQCCTSKLISDGPVPRTSMLPHENGRKQQRGHAGAKGCRAEPRTGDHALQSADPKIGERSSFQEGESDTGTDHRDSGLSQRIPK